jgi:hypothetical protein
MIIEFLICYRVMLMFVDVVLFVVIYDWVVIIGVLLLSLIVRLIRNYYAVIILVRIFME